jgi:hypothetical protein
VKGCICDCDKHGRHSLIIDHVMRIALLDALTFLSVSFQMNVRTASCVPVATFYFILFSETFHRFPISGYHYLDQADHDSRPDSSK